MRIAQLIDEMRLGGGAEELQCCFAEAVRDRDVELTVVTLHTNEPEAEARLAAHGVRVVAFPASRFASPLRARRLLHFLRRESFDVLHTHLVRSTILGALCGRATGIPVVATLHNTRPSHRLPSGLRAIESWLLRTAVDRIVAVGWETARANERRLRGRSVDVVPNAVGEPAVLDPAERTALRRELGVAPDQQLLLSVGRLNPQKAYPDLLRAVRRLDAGADVQLRIVGRGRVRRELEAEIERLGLGHCVRLTGLRLDVPRLLAASDVYASAAAWEGLPVAILEAMAAGLPVVATRVGDVPFVVTPECGQLVEPGRPDALAAALRRVLDDASLRRTQGEAGRERIAERFGADAWAQRLLDLYADLCGSDPGSAPAAPGEERACA